MEQIHLLNKFIQRLTADARLTPTHISLSIAIVQRWIDSQNDFSFRVSRRILMLAAHIRSKATYHKVLKDLQHFGYIVYRPSYHPLKASQIRLLIT